MSKNKSILIWALIVISLILFVLLQGLSKVIVGFIIFILLIASAYFDKKDWSNKFVEQIGIAVIAGLVVSIFRDLSLGVMNSKLIGMYISGFSVGAVLLLMGILGKGGGKNA